MNDLREKVKEDRGLLKKIELAIPGFRGYRKREDLRIADRLLREVLVNNLAHAVTSVEETRTALANKNELDLMEGIGKLVSRINTTTERVRHAEQGYTGISPDYRIQEEELNRLYEWDLGLLENIDGLKVLCGRMQTSSRDMPTTEMAGMIDNGLMALRNFDQIFDQRREAIAGLNVRS
jgi:hypothetical protein